MRVIILTDSADRHYYFANRILEQSNWDAKVILNGKTLNLPLSEKLKKILKRAPAKWFRNKIINIVFRQYGAKLDADKKHSEVQFFSGEKALFNTQYEDRILARVKDTDRSINDSRFIDLILAEKPDAIVVMGTCMVSKRIIEAAPCVINMHTGLSPYYRGGYTNFWPFIYNEMNCFGVTIHKMSIGIDSGDIIHSSQINYNHQDTFGIMNCKAIVKGTALMIDALNLNKEGNLRAIPQWEKGKLFHSYDYNHFYAYKYFRIKKHKNESVKANINIVCNGVIQDAFT